MSKVKNLLKTRIGTSFQNKLIFHICFHLDTGILFDIVISIVVTFSAVFIEKYLDNT